MDDCIFCKIVAGELPSKKVYEDEFALAFVNIKPVVDTHIMVIPKKHIVNLETASEEDAGVLGQVQIAIAKAAQKLGILGAYKIGVNGGKYQEVMHLHYHLLSGFKDEGGDI